MQSKIPVREAMTNKVITIAPSESVSNVAKLMLKHTIGGIVVAEKGNPIGIVTERDFIDLIADQSNLSKLTVKDVMSSPLITIAPTASVVDAAKLMTKSRTRKLPVKSKDRLIGIITAEDIVKIAPREIELLLELAAIKGGGLAEDEFIQTPMEGECEVCGNYSDLLREVNEQFVCSDCLDSEQKENVE